VSLATVVFFPESAYGPTNNCVGIADVLRDRGHRVVFVLEESFAGTLEEKGFEERLMRLQPPPEVEEEPGQFWKDFIRETGPVFRLPTIQQLAGFIQPTWQALIDGSKHVDDRLSEIFDELRPDAIVEDNVVAFPAVVTAGCPWVRIASCNPLELPDPELPPVFSGYPTGDRSGWEEFREEYRRTHAEMHADFDEFVRERGCPPLPALEFIHESPSLNLYLYPAEADYERSRALGETWHRLDSCVRSVAERFDVPEGDGHLVYVSLGSLGSADVALMQRLVDLLSAAGFRAIVSKGPQHEQIELRERQWGAELVPQPALLPHVDVVVTHGGNNTVTECFHSGKPMVVLPLFWDQHDNAQRVDELGFGVRLRTFEFEDSVLAGAIERLLSDQTLGQRLAGIARRLQGAPGTERAADLIERLTAVRRPA
jgi:MGT family glycosyltransferase